MIETSEEDIPLEGELSNRDFLLNEFARMNYRQLHDYTLSHPESHSFYEFLMTDFCGLGGSVKFMNYAEKRESRLKFEKESFIRIESIEDKIKKIEEIINDRNKAILRIENLKQYRKRLENEEKVNGFDNDENSRIKYLRLKFDNVLGSQLFNFRYDPDLKEYIQRGLIREHRLSRYNHMIENSPCT